MPWLFFFVGALLMEIRELILGRKPEYELGTLDIVAGQLPMLRRPGGARKIILGVEENARTSGLWRVFWAAGALVSMASILSAYLVLGDQPPSTLFFWAGFQLLWLVLRLVVYHVTEPADPMALRMLVVRPWATLSASLKERVIDLTFACAQCQTFTHPRGDPRYKEEAFTAHELELLLDGSDASTPMVFPLPDIPPPSLQVDIKTIFGDTSIASAMWITGTHAATPMDLYDCCVVVFTLRDPRGEKPHRTIAVPATRAFSGVSALLADSEKSVPLFVPKGVTNAGEGLTWTWWYWIPCSAGLWLQLQIPGDGPGRVLGKHRAEVRTDAQVTALLAAGKLNIGLTSVEDVKDVVELSRKGRESFLQLLS
jgi:hypothetical protein